MISASSRYRAFVLFLLGGLVSFGLRVQAQPSRTITKEADLDPDGEVELSLQAGHVQVTTWDQSTVRATVRVTGGNEKTIEEASVRMEGDSRRVTIKTDVGSGEGSGLLVLLGLGGPSGPATHYTLQVPATARLSISTESAPVEVRGLKNNLNVEGASGLVRLRDVEGSANVATFSGSLDADSVRGAINFATFSGNATVRSSRLVDALRLASFSGDAEVILPADAAFDLRTDTGWGGDVTSDFAQPDSTSEGEGAISIGGGGPTIAFESFSGSLRLRAGE
jgi:hypothetical protein